MNLSYQILWIEDNDEFIESLDLNQSIGEYIESQGFDLRIELRTQPDEIKQEVDGSRYDLLIIDYNIAEGDLHGSDVIKQIRNRNCLTEVIFYSSDSSAKLRKIACDQELEGVFFSDRDKDLLTAKIIDVFNLTVRKVIDVDNMRGIVMAGVADLDHLITDVMRAVHRSLDEGRQTAMCKHLLQKMRPAVKSLSKLVHQEDHGGFKEVEKLIDAIVALDPRDLETLLGSRHFDSYKRVEMAMSLCKEHAQLKEFRGEIESIKELLLWRNALAHQREIANQSGFPVFEIGQKPEAFDNARTLHLRQQLRGQRKLLQRVLAAASANA